MLGPMPMTRVILFVGDPLAQAEFYGRAFGFRAAEGSVATSEWVDLDTGGCRLALHKAHGYDGPTGSPDHPHKMVFHTADVAAERARLVSMGVTMGEIQTYGGRTFCDGRDPEGHVFQLSSRA